VRRFSSESVRTGIIAAMIAKTVLLADVRYSEWATRRLLGAAAELTAEERVRDLGQSHRCVVSTLNHYFLSERLWTGCLEANKLPALYTLGQSAPPPDISIEELTREWPPIWKRLEAWLAKLSEIEIAESIRCETMPGEFRDFPRWEIIRHNVNHATLHRGQVVGMLRQLGKQPPNVDIMTFYIVGSAA
jgi:uncharacterized damage-inducible protein DinB